MYAKPESACGRGVACLLPPHKDPTHGFTPAKVLLFFDIRKLFAKTKSFYTRQSCHDGLPHPFQRGGAIRI